jgi:hypothetical protein
VDADLLGNGQPTQLVDCQQNAPILIEWDFSLGENPSVQLSGTNYCLDAGTNPHNNGPAKVWECQPGVPQQKCVVRWASSSIEELNAGTAGTSPTTAASLSREGTSALTGPTAVAPPSRRTR